MDRLTVVTGFIDIGRGEEEWGSFQCGTNEYLDHFKMGVARLNCRLVVYIEAKFLNQVRSSRAHFPSWKTEYRIVTPEWLKSTRAWSLYEEAQTLMKQEGYTLYVADPERPEIRHPGYLLAMYLKFDMIDEVSRSNPFQTSHFAWIDIGFGRTGVSLGDTRLPFNPRDLLSDRVDLIQVEPFRETDRDVHAFWRSRKCRIMGGFFVGTRHALVTFIHELRRVVEFGLQHGYVDDEQTPMAYLSMQHPELTRLHYHDKSIYEWRDVINNINIPTVADIYSLESLAEFYQEAINYAPVIQQLSGEVRYATLSKWLVKRGFYPPPVTLIHLAYLLSRSMGCDSPGSAAPSFGLVINEVGLNPGLWTAMIAHFHRLTSSTRAQHIPRPDPPLRSALPSPVAATPSDHPAPRASTQPPYVEGSIRSYIYVPHAIPLENNGAFDHLQVSVTFSKPPSDDFLRRQPTPNLVFINHADVYPELKETIGKVLDHAAPNSYAVVEKTIDVDHDHHVLLTLDEWVLIRLKPTT
jgi:hypothetical protein